MGTEKEVLYRRAALADVPTLVDYRVRFLNELHSHLENSETDVVRASILGYFTKAIPSGDFVAWVA
jgi:hypothetical protein